MKKILFITLTAIALCACGSTFKTAEEKAAYEQKLASQVAEKIENRRFTIDVNYMKPRGDMPPRQVNGFSLALKGDTVVSYLPYVGEVTTAYIASGETGLNFTAPVHDYAITQPKPGLTRIQFTTRSKEDRYHFMVEVFGNGRSSIAVVGDSHQPIDFDGDMQLNY
ncbi:MAG: DUF4251 domain-containing protein [Bacteroidales bacterium]|nr:DUF4251 domain-containing protein [Bacteroidales bacterium]